MSDDLVNRVTLRACELKTFCPEATVDECLLVAYAEETCGDDEEADTCDCARCLGAPLA